MDISDREKEKLKNLIDNNKKLPPKYKLTLFEETPEVELVWNGKTDDVTNVVLPFQHIEQIDEPRTEVPKEAMQLGLFDEKGRQQKGWVNKLIWGDNKLVLSSLKNGPVRQKIEDEGGIKLIYIDPPFDVGADFSHEVEIGGEDVEKKPSVIEEVAYRDTWGKGSNSYLSMMYERLKIMKGLLAEDGIIYVHCDWRVSSYLRILLDEIFGKERIMNELIWHYQTYQGQVKNYFPKKHDTIFSYTKSDRWNFELLYDSNYEDTINYKRWEDYIVDGNKIKGNFYPSNDSRFMSYYNKWVEKQNREPTKDDVILEIKGNVVDSVWDIKAVDPKSRKRLNYPTQKPEKLLKRIIKSSTSENDLVADFFCGSGTTMAVAEKLNRKWIGADLSRFAIHTSRKRLINIQRKKKKNGEDYRAFKIMNLGKYERQYFTGIRGVEVNEEKFKQREEEYLNLILEAYKAQRINSFRTCHGKKGSKLVFVGPIDIPVTIKDVREVINECKEKEITRVDVLGFEFEMGLIEIIPEEARKEGVKLSAKYIPNEVFDKKAVEKEQVKFYDVAYVEFKPIIKGKKVKVELKDFGLYYTQNNVEKVSKDMRKRSSKVVIDNGNVVKIEKDKNGIISNEILTKKWTDWIDYWAIDFEYESKKEIIRIKNENNDYKEKWTGGYIFENQWQSFRTKNDRKLELESSFYNYETKGEYKICVKVIDIFGNDTSKVRKVQVE